MIKPKTSPCQKPLKLGRNNFSCLWYEAWSIEEGSARLGSSQDPQPYQWTIQTDQEETWDKYEHRGTLGPLKWLKENSLVPNDQYDLKVVTGTNLPKVKGNRRSATEKLILWLVTKMTFTKGPLLTLQWVLLNSRPTSTPWRWDRICCSYWLCLRQAPSRKLLFFLQPTAIQSGKFSLFQMAAQ